jgi:hypothetical protein
MSRDPHIAPRPGRHRAGRGRHRLIPAPRPRSARRPGVVAAAGLGLGLGLVLLPQVFSPPVTPSEPERVVVFPWLSPPAATAGVPPTVAASPQTAVKLSGVVWTTRERVSSLHGAVPTRESRFLADLPRPTTPPESGPTPTTTPRPHPAATTPAPTPTPPPSCQEPS